MDIERLRPVLTAHGVLPMALPDAEARAERHFGQGDADTTAVDSWLAGLKETAPHLVHQEVSPARRLGIPPDLWQHLSPAERLARFRASQPPPPMYRPPQPLELSEGQLRELAGMAPIARLTHHRALQEQQR